MKLKDQIYNLLIPNEPTVSMGGFTLGGGISFMTSWYGIMAHYLHSVELITPDG